jgi:hypothetical protein
MRIIGVAGSQNTKGFLQPNPPTIGTATDIGTNRAYNNGAATVTFTPSASGAPATSYTVTSSPGGFTGTGSSSPITVTGLQSNVSYTFSVTGTNGAGTGGASGSSSSITATTVPQAPTITGTSPNTGGVGRVNVSFNNGATGGKAISTNTVSSNPGSIVVSGSSTIVVSGLTGNSNYTFTVTATNANGTSAASAASSSTRASGYSCSVGSLSGSQCTYAATSYLAYQCASGDLYGLYYTSPYAGCAEYEPWYGNIICKFQHRYYEGSSYIPPCVTYTAYYCPSGGSLSGSTCYINAAIS